MRELVLVILDRPEPVAACLEAARQAARSLTNARIAVLHVRISPASTILPSEEVLTPERKKRLSERESNRAAAVRDACFVWLNGSDSEMQSRFVWTDVESTIDEEVRRRGSEADLIVLPQPAPSRDHQGAQILRTAVLGTDRPILIVPRSGLISLGQSVAIFWTDDRATTKATLNAMPLLASAGQVYVLSLQRGTNGVAAAVPRVLADHDVDAEVRVIHPSFRQRGPAVLQAAHDVGADMLVMGAHPDWVVAQWVMRGVTPYMFANSDVPLFVRH